MVFDGPDGVEDDGVAKLDLIDRIAVGALFSFALAAGMRRTPGLRSVDFVEEVQFQFILPSEPGARRDSAGYRAQPTT